MTTLHTTRPEMSGSKPARNVLVPGAGTGAQAMYAVGVVEIVAGLVVAIVPRFGGWLGVHR
jgi:hypothetical protein